MKNLILIAVIVAAGWYGNYRYKLHQDYQTAAPEIVMPRTISTMYQEVSSSDSFRCDGRTYCSQMTSCAEATFFLKNCPGVKMDGDGDGIPCESQWCGFEQSNGENSRFARRRH